eukprot:473580-Pleurochrysis_carterae.AAC.1
MSTDFNALIRAVYKELHHEGAYAKGKGRRDFMPLQCPAFSSTTLQRTISPRAHRRRESGP